MKFNEWYNKYLSDPNRNNLGEREICFMAFTAGENSNPVEAIVRQKAEFTPIVAHVIMRTKKAEELLEDLISGMGNVLYIDYTQSLMSYKAEQE